MADSVWRLRVENGNADGLDAAMVRQALALLVDPQHHVQYQVLRSAQWVNLPGQDHDAALAWLASHSGEQGLYWTINPIPHLTRASKSSDALRRRWFLVDLDPIRPKDSNSTEEEHEEARKTALAIKGDLEDIGWPMPILIDSGNGWHLLWRIDLPSDKDTQKLLRLAIKELGRRYADKNVEVDLKTHDAHRISKLPGTWARKGPHSEERPHRLARLIYRPDTLEVVAAEQLQALADAGGKPTTGVVPAPSSGTSGTRGAFQLQAGNDGDGGKRYAQRALEGETVKVLSAPGGKRNNTLFEAALKLGGFIPIGLLAEHEVIASLERAALAAGLAERETQATIASGLEKGKENPREIPERQGGPAPSALTSPTTKTEQDVAWEVTLDGEVLAEGTLDAVIEAAVGDQPDLEASGKRSVVMLTMGALIRHEFPDPVWAIPGIMSEGLNILAGAPKQGKSMLALNLALTLAGGGTALGNIRVTSQDVLYLSLEDQHRRVKDRALRMLKGLRDAGQRSELERRLVVATDWPKADRGGLTLLDMWHRRAQRPGMVIIDVWNRFAPEQKPNASTYHQDADAMAALKRYADRRKLTVLVIHHTRKTGISKEPDDFVQEISGTLGLAGTADGIMVLLRSRGEARANLRITGRDCVDQDLVIAFDDTSLVWTSQGTRDEDIRGRVQMAVTAYLRSIQPAGAWPKDIAIAINEDRVSVGQACIRLAAERNLRRIGNGAYAYPGDPDDAFAEGNL